MPALAAFGRELKEKFAAKGFVLDINLIEIYSTFARAAVNAKFLPRVVPAPENIKHKNIAKTKLKNFAGAKNSHQESALVCAVMAYFHAEDKTRWLGYKDGFVFMPQLSLWIPEWREKFRYAWKQRHPFKYRYLKTNLF